MPTLLVTLLQHVLEDPLHLLQSMESTVKMCWVRLSRLKASKVTFKQLIEILAPLIHRDQGTFLQVIHANIRLFRSEGQLYTALKESSQKVPSVGAEITSNPSTDKKSSNSSTLWTLEKSDKVKLEKQHTVSTPQPSLPVHTSSGASSVKRQKTAQSYNSDNTNNAVIVAPITTSNSSCSNTVLTAGKTPLRSSMKDKRRKSTDISTPCVHVNPPVSTAQAIIEELLGLAVSQWSRLQAATNHFNDNYGETSASGSKNTSISNSSHSSNSINNHLKFDGTDGCSQADVEKIIQKSMSPLCLPSAPCHLTIAEIVLVVADLVAAVPGLATCVHR